MNLKVSASVFLLLVLSIFTNNQSVWAKGQTNKHPVKRITALNAVDGSSAAGIASTNYRPGRLPHQDFQVIATGLTADTDYLLVVDGKQIDSARTDSQGAVEFLYSSKAKIE